MTDSVRSSLKQSLDHLHAELARAPKLDENARQRLRAALADIERRLRASEGEPPVAVRPGGGASHPLEALAVGFESEHPTLAASVRRFIDLLAQGGL
jgi:hypothetical protein